MLVWIFIYPWDHRWAGLGIDWNIANNNGVFGGFMDRNSTEYFSNALTDSVNK